MKKAVAALWVFSLYATVCLAQDPYSITIDKSKGLPSNAVYYMLQDSKGFIWFATDEGLCRYDGFAFKTYSSAEQTSKSGSEIHEDAYGRIWYENFDGYLYYVENDSLKPFKQNTPAGYLPFGIIKDRLFVVQKNGLAIYDVGSFKLIKTVPIDFATLSKTQQTRTHFYVMEEYLNEIDGNGNVSKIRLPAIQQHQLPSILQSAEDSLFLISTYNSRELCYTVRNKTVTAKFSVPGINAIQSTAYTAETYWFCTPKGVYGFKENGTPVNKGKPLFADKSISCVLKDREGNFWFSTVNEGVLLVSDIHSLHIATPYQPFRIAVNKNSMYIGTKNDEVYRFNLHSLQSEMLYKGSSNAAVYYLQWDSGENKIYYTASEFKILKESGAVFFSWAAAVKDIKKINEKYYAVAMSGAVGLLSFHDKTPNEWDSLIEKNPNKGQRAILGDIISSVRGKSVAYDKKNNIIYYATNNGLFAVTPNAVEELKYEGKSVYIATLQRYENTILGLSTQGQLFEIGGKNKIIVSAINREIGFQPIKKINLQNHLLFLFTEKQLFFYDFIKNKPGKMMMDFQFSEISDLAVWQNKLVLANPSGILISDFTEEKDSLLQPLFVVNSLEVNNHPQHLASRTELKHFENNIAINYSILSFKTGSNFPLYYKINEHEWELASPETRSLKLASLAPGDYTIAFRLGETAAVVETLQFNIAKPLWLQNWFLLLSGLLIAGAVYGYYKRQIRSLRRRNKLLSEKIELEQNLNRSILTSIKSQMNPHFFYNALNTIQSFIFTDDKKNATHYLSKFSKLTRLILEMSDKETITLAEELTALNLYLDMEKVRFNDDFEFSITVDERIDRELTKIPAMLIQPYIENAIKHGLLHKKGRKNLAVSFTAQGNTVKVSIDDNGIGRKHSAALTKNKHQSFSTNANQKRLELLNRGKENKTVMEIIDKTTPDNDALGTTVILLIPIL